MEFHHCYVSEKAIDLVTQTLRSQKLSEGEQVKRFEQALSGQLGLRSPVCVNSGTSALHLALVLAGVSPGDEVILPAQTFLATGMVVLYCGAKPVFADIDPWTGNINPEDVKQKITSRTKVILPVHWAGNPCDLETLQFMALMQGKITIVEDAAHALGAWYHGLPIGDSITRFTCFSLQAVKHLTTGDGGILCCPSLVMEDEARHRRWFALSRLAGFDSLGERDWLAEKIGFKYHMNDVAASIGLGNLDGFRERRVRRRAIAEQYRRELVGVKGVKLLHAPENERTVSAAWMFPLRVERRDAFVQTMKSRGIPCSVVNRRIDRHPVFGGMRDLPGTEEFDREQINLPTHDGLSWNDVDRIIAAVKEGW